MQVIILIDFSCRESFWTNNVCVACGELKATRFPTRNRTQWQLEVTLAIFSEPKLKQIEVVLLGNLSQIPCGSHSRIVFHYVTWRKILKNQWSEWVWTCGLDWTKPLHGICKCVIPLKIETVPETSDVFTSQSLALPFFFMARLALSRRAALRASIELQSQSAQQLALRMWVRKSGILQDPAEPKRAGAG